MKFNPIPNQIPISIVVIEHAKQVVMAQMKSVTKMKGLDFFVLKVKIRQRLTFSVPKMNEFVDFDHVNNGC